MSEPHIIGQNGTPSDKSAMPTINIIADAKNGQVVLQFPKPLTELRFPGLSAFDLGQTLAQVAVSVMLDVSQNAIRAEKAAGEIRRLHG